MGYTSKNRQGEQNMTTETEKQAGQEFGDTYYRELAIQLVKNARDAFNHVAKNLDDYVDRMSELDDKTGIDPAQKQIALSKMLNSAMHTASNGVGSNLRIDQMANCQAHLATYAALAQAHQGENIVDSGSHSARKTPKAK
jgi:hypothetical protein